MATKLHFGFGLIGQLGGFAGNYAVGFLNDRTHSLWSQLRVHSSRLCRGGRPDPQFKSSSCRWRLPEIELARKLSVAGLVGDMNRSVKRKTGATFS